MATKEKPNLKKLLISDVTVALWHLLQYDLLLDDGFVFLPLLCVQFLHLPLLHVTEFWDNKTQFC